LKRTLLVYPHWGSIIFAFGPTVHLLVVVLAILLLVV
ncbi:hypothetical protein T12_12356, partial [Trichinella patagoniensis]